MPGQGERTPRTAALKLIIAYKVVKAPAMLGLAIFLTVAPCEALHFAAYVAHELSFASAVWVRLGHWIDEHLSTRIVRWGAVLAWLDFLSTSLEAILLILGKAWGEWLVMIGLAALTVPELLSLERKPSAVRFLVLLVNGAVVVYLAARRLRAARMEKSRRPA